MKKLGLILTIGSFCLQLGAGSAFDNSAFDLNATAQGNLSGMSVNDAEAFVTSARNAVGLIATDKVTKDNISCGDLQAALLMATSGTVSEALKAKKDVLSGLLDQVNKFISDGTVPSQSSTTTATTSSSTTTTTTTSTAVVSGTYVDPVAFLDSKWAEIKTKRQMPRDITLESLKAFASSIVPVVKTAAPVLANPNDTSRVRDNLNKIRERVSTLLNGSTVSISQPEKDFVLTQLAESLNSLSNITNRQRLDILDFIYSKPEDENGRMFAASAGGEQRFLDLVNFMMNSLSSMGNTDLETFSWILEEAADRVDYSASTKKFLQNLLARPEFQPGYNSKTVEPVGKGVVASVSVQQTVDWVDSESKRLINALGTLTSGEIAKYLDDCEKLAKTYRRFYGNEITPSSRQMIITQVESLKNSIQGNYRFTKDPEKSRVRDIANIIDGNLSLNQQVAAFSTALASVKSDDSATSLFNSFKDYVLDSSTGKLKESIKKLAATDLNTLQGFVEELRGVLFFGAFAKDLNDISARLTGDGMTFGESLEQLLDSVTSSTSSSDNEISEMLRKMRVACDKYNALRAKKQTTASDLTKLVEILDATQNSSKGSSMKFRRITSNKALIDQMKSDVQSPLSMGKQVQVLSDNLNKIRTSSNVTESDLSNMISDVQVLAERFKLLVVLGTVNSADLGAMRDLIDRMKAMDLFSVDRQNLESIKGNLTGISNFNEKYKYLLEFCSKVVNSSVSISDDVVLVMQAISGVLYPALASLSVDQVDLLKTVVSSALNLDFFSANQKTDLKKFVDGIDTFKTSKTVTPVSTVTPAALTPSPSPTLSPAPAPVTTPSPSPTPAPGIVDSGNIGRAVENPTTAKPAPVQVVASSGATRKRSGQTVR